MRKECKDDCQSLRKIRLLNCSCKDKERVKKLGATGYKGWRRGDSNLVKKTMRLASHRIKDDQAKLDFL